MVCPLWGLWGTAKSHDTSLLVGEKGFCLEGFSIQVPSPHENKGGDLGYILYAVNSSCPGCLITAWEMTF